MLQHPMILHPLLWYLTITLLGWLTFPLAYHLLPALADRGYAFSRALGWLLWGYLFWLLASLGVVGNDAGGLLFSLLLLVGLSAWALRKITFAQLAAWWRGQRRLIIYVELLFLVSFAAIAVIRAANPEILGTEKPMELAFINAILNSPSFPPHDPWLSGYAISYYYFGYVLVAMLAKIAGTSGGIAFNLGISLVFALSAIGVYGIVYNLLAVRQRKMDLHEPEARSLSLSFLGPVFILLVGNLEGVLHVLHTRGLFWGTNTAGELVSGFWKWVDIQDLNQPPAQPFAWVPSRFWWWWRASRVLQDYDAAGGSREIIDEFPVFSYLLADLHPHVLVMPFAFLSLALVMNLLLGGGSGRLQAFERSLRVRTLAWVGLLFLASGFVLLWMGAAGLSLRTALLGVLCLAAGGAALVYIIQSVSQLGVAVFSRGDSGSRLVGLSFDINPQFLLVSAVALGGMAFLNTWDFPFYVAFFAAGYVVFRYLHAGDNRPESDENAESASSYPAASLVKDYIGIAVLLGVMGALLYLPFYLGFSSQAGGVLPSLIYITRGLHLWVMFGVLLLPIACYLGYLWLRQGSRTNLRRSTLLILFAFLGLLGLSILLGFLIARVPVISDLFLNNLAAESISSLLRETFVRRLVSPGGWITLLVLLVFTTALLLPRAAGKGLPSSVTRWLSPENSYALLLVLFGCLLVIGPEFFYLRDQFGWRMNTIFKFYFTAWMIWGAAAAYGSAVLIRDLSLWKSRLYTAALLLVIGMGLVYTVFGFLNKTEGFSPSQGWTLDGTAYMERQTPGEMAAIRWLAEAPPGVVAEAVGGSYSNYARVSTLSGQPTVLGWPGHESQWRGGGYEIGSRQTDIQRLYCSRDWGEAMAIIDQYGIEYIYIGPLERSTYTPQTCGTGLYEAKFAQHLVPVYQQDDVTIYQAH